MEGDLDDVTHLDHAPWRSAIRKFNIDGSCSPSSNKNKRDWIMVVVSNKKPATTTTTTTSSSSSSLSILLLLLSSPSFSWLAVFVAALSYFVATRFASVGGISIGGAARVGPVLTHHVQLLYNDDDHEKAITAAAICQSLSQLLYCSCPSLTVNNNDPSSLSSSFSSSTLIRLSQPLLIAQTNGLEDIVATTWRHDEEMGRGYLLLSQSSGAGRVWRWEVGGGPFAIGKTLHLDQAGCRSSQYLPCPPPPTTTKANTSSAIHQQLQQQQQNVVGSGGLAIDFGGQERFAQGHLVLAEWGEGRIVRMEDNGARTPLLLHVPNLCEATTTTTTTSTTTGSNNGDDNNNNKEAEPRRRLHQPTQLLFTPFGDLMILERNLGCSGSSSNTDSVDDDDDDDESAIFIMRQAVHVPALTSLSHSRQAHSWSTLNHTTTTTSKNVVHVMLHHYQHKYKQTIGGMALTPQWTSIYVSTRLHHDGSVVLLQVPIVSSDDDDDDDENDDSTAVEMQNDKVHMVLNLTHHLPLIQQAGSIAVTSQGYVFMVAPPYGLVVMHVPTTAISTTNAAAAAGGAAAARVLGYLEIPQPPIPNKSRASSAVANNNDNTTPMTTTITSLTLGEDGYLYMSTSSAGGALLRLRVRDHPVKVPVNLVTNKKTMS